MMASTFWKALLFHILLNVTNVLCIKNLFLPKTGDISLGSVIAENLQNVTNFQSLLGAGRSLAYPFSAGMILSIATLANENNWKVSDTGLAKVLGIPQEEIVESYGTLLEMLEADENVTLSNLLYSFRPNYSPSEALVDALMTEVREANWTKETWKDTYKSMTEHLGNVTNEKIDTLLIPSVTKIGTPFRKSTEAVVISTFHYINTWQYAWTDGEIGKFSGNDGIPYVKVEGKFMVAYEEEFTAVAVPLEGGSKSVVFVLPHANLTSKVFRNQAEDKEEDEQADVVPFPTKWQMKTLRLKVPSFNTTDVDQYGQELEQVGVNETFCTIIKDYFGKYPYYLRPMVQVNFLDFNEDFIELASATGVAVEKFQSIFSIISGDGEKEDAGKKTQQQQLNSIPQTESKNSSPISPRYVSLSSEDDIPGTTTEASNNSGFIKLDEPMSESEIPILSFDRPFLWYLNDSNVGPMFFGTVETLVNPAFAENSTEPEGEGNTTTMPGFEDQMNNSTSGSDNNEILSELDKYFLWSCRSFALSKGQELPSSANAVGNEYDRNFNESGKENESAGTTLSSMSL